MQKVNHDWKCGRDFEIIPLDSRQSLLFLACNHRVLKVSADLGHRLQEGLSAMTAEEGDEWRQLEASGALASHNREAVRSSSFQDGANLAVNVNLTSFCNLGCTYCFADGGDYGRITGRMQSETVDGIFAFIEAHVTSSQIVRFEFFGGEPLLNFERINEVCRRADELERNRGIRFLHRISTNLTVLPQQAVELFARKGFIVSVSIDGGRATHDRNRPTKSGEGSFHSIIENCQTVREASSEITMVARMTVVGGGERLIQNVRELWTLNIFDYFQIYPGVVPAELSNVVNSGETLIQLGAGDNVGACDDSSGGSCQTRIQGSAMYSGFLAEQAEFAASYSEFFHASNRFRGVLEFERIVDLVQEGKAALSFCSAGRNYFTISPDNSIMPCHRLVGEPDFQVGDSSRSDSSELRGLPVWRSPADEHPICSQCWVRYICAGGCKQENYIGTGDLNEPNPEGCEYQRQLVASVVATMAQQKEEYLRADRRPLDDLFVSCGRPVVMTRRAEDVVPEGLQHFRPLSRNLED